ncbi:MAG: thermonuclease family protein [Thermodesulfobacteriota bacterium]|nr:thermonuclease family protein [Thermodesulfobacteriota bacterium]
MTKQIVIFMVILLTAAMVQGEIYFWSDSKGIRHFSNISHPSLEKNLQKYNENKRESIVLPEFKNKKKQFKVLKVYDGDSIKVTGYTLTFMVRLVGIDAPESGRKGTLGQPYSKQSKKLLKKYVSGQKINLKSYGTGGYNRQLAEIFINGINVNIEMVKAGLAEVYRGTSPSDLNTAPYHLAEADAKRSYRGIWSLGSKYKSPRTWRKEHPR